MAQVSKADLEAMMAMMWKVTPATLGAYLTRHEPAASRYRVPRHVDFLSMTVAKAVGGHGNKRIIVNMPPQHGKSKMISQYTPVWYLENFPYRRVILGSYSGDYSAQWGRRARETIEGNQDQLSLRLSPSSSAADEWETSRGGGMTAVGVGGAATGRSADGLLIIDDPHKDAKEANSATMRQNVWDWFTSVALTRLGPEAVMLIVQTRWHPDDLTGRIMRQMEDDPDFPRFEIINLPALAESEDDAMGRKPGQALWPERYDEKWLDSQRRLVGSYVWNSLYQGRPTAPEGGFFKRAWFDNRVEKIPDGRVEACVRSWDLAATVEGEKGNSDPDYTVGVKLTKVDGVVYVSDLIRVRQSSMNVERLVGTTASRDGRGVRIRMQQDPGQGGKFQISNYARRILSAYDFRGIISTLDKTTRAGAFNAACERGDVVLVRGAWNEQFVEELTTFPSAKHDDVLDACTIGWNDLTGQGGAWDAAALASAFSYRGRGGHRKTSVMDLLAMAKAGEN